MKHGAELILRLGDKVLASCVDASVEVSQEYITAAHEYARTGKVIPTTYTMQMSSECLVADYNDYKVLQQYETDGAKVEAEICMGSESYKCKVLMSNVRIAGSVGKLIRMSASMTASGNIYSADDFLPYFLNGVLYTRFEVKSRVLKTNGYVTNGVLKFK